MLKNMYTKSLSVEIIFLKLVFFFLAYYPVYNARASYPI